MRWTWGVVRYKSRTDSVWQPTPNGPGMGALDPSYPFYPIICLTSATLLFLILLTNIVRQKWNLGIALLCVFLFFEHLTLGINAIVWSDNADVKLYVYCDIGVYAPAL